MKMIAIPLALMMVSAPVVALQSSAAYAQDMSQGADNFYKSDRVTIEKVTFRNKLGMKVVGNLFVPKNLNRSARTPAIVVGHPMGAVKEQSSNLYATKLAEQGFVTLSFDLSFWGESEGQPRNTVAPDIYVMISALPSISSARRHSSTPIISACLASAEAAASLSVPRRSTRA